MSSPHALVLGAGVNGLTTAIRLREAGWDVALWSERPPAETTSAVAPALCLPYKVFPPDRVLRWATHSFAVFKDLAEVPAVGIQMREGVELWHEPVPDPWWRGVVDRFERCGPADLPPGYRDGYRFTVPVIEMPIYLAYLLERFLAGGGRYGQRTVGSLAEASSNSEVVVNCTGLGSRTVVPDDEMTPIRGQIVRVANPGLTRFVLDEESMTYIVPRSHDCVLGGTVETGAWDLTPDPATAAAIVARCTALEPRLATAAILEHKVGLRPGRPAVRLECETLASSARCVHNYGHGGAGVTLSWGCAEDVLALLSPKDHHSV